MCCQLLNFKVSLELSGYRGNITDGLGHKVNNVVQSSEYTVTGMSKKFYFPIR